MDLVLLSLSEYHFRFENNKYRYHSKPILRLFCSYLDLTSLKLVYHIYNSDLLNNLSIMQIDGNLHNDLTVEAVFFPISSSFKINNQLKRQLLNIIHESTCEDDFDRKISIILDMADKSILQRQAKYIEHKYDINFHVSNKNKKTNSIGKINPSESSSESTNDEKFLEDRFMFGSLAAMYLKKYRRFPTLVVGDQVYNGIPLNYNIEKFTETVIPQHFNEKF
jgi:hypothetical protein